MKQIAVFPGSFDPVTLGHVDIINRGLKVFEKIVIGIGNNSQKKYMFSLNQRMDFLKTTFKNENRIEILSYEGLTVDFCTKVHANFILRGLRTSADFEFEKAIAHMNQAINPSVETYFVLSDLKFAALSSSIIRDIIRNGGDVSSFVPNPVVQVS